MSKMEFLDPKETEKFKKQKRVQFCRTPCTMITTGIMTIIIMTIMVTTIIYIMYLQVC